MQFIGQKAEQPASTACLLARKCHWLARKMAANMHNATCARTKLHSFRRKWPFCMDLYSVLWRPGQTRRNSTQVWTFFNMEKREWIFWTQTIKKFQYSINTRVNYKFCCVLQYHSKIIHAPLQAFFSYFTFPCLLCWILFCTSEVKTCDDLNLVWSWLNSLIQPHNQRPTAV
jgi:hypothetical protein